MKKKNNNNTLYKDLTSKDKQALNLISKTLKDKINYRLNQIKEETGEEINHISINYFNTSALSKPTAMNTVDYVAVDKDNNIKYLNILVYFGDERLNQLTASTMMKFVADKHVWRHSSNKNEPCIDLNGVLITNYNPVKAGLIKLMKEDIEDGSR